MNLLKTPLIAALLCGAAPALAVGAAADTAADAAANASADAAAEGAAEGANQSEIVVEGQRQEYGARATATATRTNTDIRNIPQALTVISERQIEDQQLRSVAELLMFVPGATPGTGESNRDQITLRGNNSTADFFIDGMRDDVQYFRDFYNVDRVEVLKGPNAMIFGRGGGGGVVNRVLKRASMNPHRKLMAAGDSYGGMRLTADVGQPLGSGVGLRVNGMYENGDSFRRHVDLERYAINPVLGAQLGSATRLDFGFEHLRDRRTADRGVPSFGGDPVKGFDRTFFGDPDESLSRASVNIGSLGGEHRFSDALTLRNRTLYADYDKFYQNIYPNAAVTDRDGAGPQPLTVRLAAYNDTTKRKNLLSQTDLIWNARFGSVEQTLLLGFELGRQKGRNQRRNGVFATSGTSPTFFDVPLSDPTVDVPAISFLENGANNGIKTTIAAAYIQDQIQLTDWLELVAGLRFDSLSIDVRNRNNGLNFERTDKLWSPRAGLVLKPRDNLSIYASYSRSYLPQSGDQFNSLDVTLEALKPEKIDNYELGAKWEPVEGLLATAAVYQLDRANTRAAGAVPGTVVLTGAQRSRGVELGLERSITHRWQVSAGYAWQDAEITETTSAAPEGRKVPLVPKHSFSLWNRYDISDRIGVGLGVLARSKSYASISNAVKLPGYARVDGAVYYQLTPGIEAQVNVENLFGADYFPTAHNDNNIARGAPRTVKASIGYRF